MALPTIKFSTVESCDSQNIVFTDTTGLFSESNSGGWGAPNSALGDVLDVEINITDPAGTIHNIDSNVLGGVLPNASNNGFMINMSHLGGTAQTTMTQGLYRIEYRVLVNDGGIAGVWLAVRKWVFAYSTIKCCVHKMLASLDMCDDCPCDSEKQNALEAYTLYKAMLYASSCGSITKADKIFKQVSRLCNYKGPCNTCS